MCVPYLFSLCVHCLLSGRLLASCLFGFAAVTDRPCLGARSRFNCSSSDSVVYVECAECGGSVFATAGEDKQQDAAFRPR